MSASVIDSTSLASKLTDLAERPQNLNAFRDWFWERAFEQDTENDSAWIHVLHALSEPGSDAEVIADVLMAYSPKSTSVTMENITFEARTSVGLAIR